MNLRHLTDKALLNETLYWANQERQALIHLLNHLGEIDKRKLYSEIKCTSLFDYCVKVLRYAEGQASRRVSACRLLRQHPEISQDIQKGELNLTQLNQVSKFFKEENIKDPEKRKEVLSKIKNKTTRETDLILWELKKEGSPRRVTVILKEETLQELKRLQRLKAHSCPDLDTLLIRMSSEVTRIWDPTLVKRKRKLTEGDTRYISVQVKAYVWERDKGQCVNCGSTHALELDHIRPFAIGGKTVVENLRLLCRNCNQRKGLEYFGPMRPKPNFSSQ